jgi:hypothetical protein
MGVVSVLAEYAAAEERLPGSVGAIPVKALGWSLSLFFAISFVLCVLGYLFERAFNLQLPIAHGALSILLPGFEFNNWPRFLLGLAESLAWGWYIALIWGPLYNHFVFRVGKSA